MEEKKRKKGGGGGTLTSNQKDWAEFHGCIKWISNDQSLQWQLLENLPSCIMSQSILCNNFKVCMKFTLEEAE